MNSFSFITALSGLIFLVTGLIMKLRPPQKINSLYGYRTPRSMKNQENWTEANRYSAILLIRSSILMLLLASLAPFFIQNETIAWISAIILVIIVALNLIIMTEYHLKKMFG